MNWWRRLWHSGRVASVEPPSGMAMSLATPGQVALLPVPTLGQDARGLPPLTLAFVGDAVFELYVRTRLVAVGHTRPGILHRQAVTYVRARAQADALKAVAHLLSPEELDLVRRGRNAKPGHIPKGAQASDYHMSSGFEALVGYLYLSGCQDRLDLVLTAVVKTVESQ